MNFESFEWIDMKEAKALYAHIREATKASGKYYILLDEIQEVTDWEKAVNAFLVDLFGRKIRCLSHYDFIL